MDAVLEDLHRCIFAETDMLIKRRVGLLPPSVGLVDRIELCLTVTACGVTHAAAMEFVRARNAGETIRAEEFADGVLAELRQSLIDLVQQREPAVSDSSPAGHA